MRTICSRSNRTHISQHSCTLLIVASGIVLALPASRATAAVRQIWPPPARVRGEPVAGRHCNEHQHRCDVDPDRAQLRPTSSPSSRVSRRTTTTSTLTAASTGARFSSPTTLTTPAIRARTRPWSTPWSTRTMFSQWRGWRRRSSELFRANVLSDVRVQRDRQLERAAKPLRRGRVDPGLRSGRPSVDLSGEEG